MKNVCVEDTYRYVEVYPRADTNSASWQWHSVITNTQQMLIAVVILIDDDKRMISREGLHTEGKACRPTSNLLRQNLP
jgi:hypothetical protein